MFSLVYTSKLHMDDDVSVMTYRGHRVAKTLQRAKFSPASLTGQRYIYAGCASGRLVCMLKIYNICVLRCFFRRPVLFLIISSLP